MKKAARIMTALLALLLVLAGASCETRKETETVNGTAEPAAVTAGPYDGMTDTELENSILSAYSSGDGTLNAEARAAMNALCAQNPEKGAAWNSLMDYWVRVNTEMTVNNGVCEDGLPADDSLCIVVLGYQLNADGSMTDELTGRLTTALNCAEKYPAARIAVTGGGTAYSNPDATEADSMAAWLTEHGVDADRIIIENQSLTTSENALYTGALMADTGIRELVIVTSDYHVKRGCMVFAADLYLTGSEIRVVSTAAYDTGRGPDSTPAVQASEVRGVVTRLE